MAAPAAEDMLHFGNMNEAQLRQRVGSNPGRVDARDKDGDTPLLIAAWWVESLPLVVWLLDEKGADVNATTSFGLTPLHWADSLDILNALLDRGADPTVRSDGLTPLMGQVLHQNVDNVARLLQDPLSTCKL